MARTAFLFSGQGGQGAGMGRDLCEAFSTVREVYEEASEVLGYPVQGLAQNQLGNPEIVQPAIVTLSYACYMLLTEKDVEADAMAGYSLGELSALAAAGAISFADALKLARLRGRLIQQNSHPEKYAMCTLLGSSALQCEQFCANIKGYVVCAMYNASEQIVVGGDKKAVAEAQRAAITHGAPNTLFQDGAVPIHTEKMRPTVAPMSDMLSDMRISNPKLPVPSNLDGSLFNENNVAQLLSSQLVNPVHWDRVCEKLFELGAEHYIELGPGKVLCSGIGKMNRSVKAHEVEDMASLVRFLVGK